MNRTAHMRRYVSERSFGTFVSATKKKRMNNISSTAMAGRERSPIPLGGQIPATLAEEKRLLDCFDLRLKGAGMEELGIIANRISRMNMVPTRTLTSLSHELSNFQVWQFSHL